MRENRAFNLLELVFVMFFISISSYFLLSKYRENLLYNKSYSEKIKIINIVNFAIKKAEVDKKEYQIFFNLKEYNIKFLDEIILLDKDFIYETNNKSNNFSRYITKNNNINIGFTIKIKGKNNKVYRNITYKTNNGLSSAILDEKDSY